MALERRRGFKPVCAGCGWGEYGSGVNGHGEGELIKSFAHIADERCEGDLRIRLATGIRRRGNDSIYPTYPFDLCGILTSISRRGTAPKSHLVSPAHQLSMPTNSETTRLLTCSMKVLSRESAPEGNNNNAHRYRKNHFYVGISR